MLHKKLVGQAKLYTGHLLLIGGLALAGGGCIVTQADFFSRIIADVFIGQQRIAQVQPLFEILLGVVLVRALVLFALDMTGQQLAARIKRELRQRLVTHSLALGPVLGAGEQNGELAALAVDGIENLEAYFAKYLPQVCLAAIIPLLVMVVVFRTDMVSGLILLITAPLIPLFMVLIGYKAEQKAKAQWQELTSLQAHFLDVLQGLDTLKLFGRSREQIAVVRRLSGQFGEATLRILKIAFLSALVLELTATISTAVVAVSIGLRLLYAKLEFQQALFILLLAPDFFLPLRQLGAHFHTGISSAAAAERIFAFLAQPLAGAAFGRQPLDSSPVEIRFADVSFAYPGRAEAAVHNVSFVLPPGTKTAIVGASGAGKSTLVNLLLGFAVPQQGQIYLNEKPLHDYSLDAWRQQLAFVPQQPHIFGGTVRDNLLLGTCNKDEQHMIAAAKAAGIHAWIERLPAGYDTMLGTEQHGFSGGERQRLAIARALLQDAPVLILDEASASLDSYHESLIEAALEELTADKTVVVIAHRLSTVYNADCILVLADGQIVERGTHRQLLQRQGLYYDMVTAYQEVV